MFFNIFGNGSWKVIFEHTLSSTVWPLGYNDPIHWTLTIFFNICSWIKIKLLVRLMYNSFGASQPNHFASVHECILFDIHSCMDINITFFHSVFFFPAIKDPEGLYPFIYTIRNILHCNLFKSIREVFLRSYCRTLSSLEVNTHILSLLSLSTLN